jgi:hypothetical protein
MAFKKMVMVAGISGLVLTVGGQAWSGQKIIIGSPDAKVKVTDTVDETKTLIKAGDAKVKTNGHGAKIKAGDASVNGDGSIDAGGVKIDPNGGIKID